MKEDKGTDSNSNRDWKTVISGYNRPDRLKSWWQIINSVGPYIILWILMVKSIEISYWLTLLLAVPAAGFNTMIIPEINPAIFIIISYLCILILS